MRSELTAKVAILVALLAGVFSASTGAIPVSVMGISNTTVSDVAYNAITHVFTENASIGVPAEPIRQAYLFGGGGAAYDIAGTYNLTAEVDNSGVFHGGSFFLIGTSRALGILAPTILFSGPVVDVQASTESHPLEFANFASVVNIAFEAPQLFAAIGTVDFWRVNTYGVFVPQPPTIWTRSFGIPPTHGDTSPTIFGFRDVPEPASLLLLLAAPWVFRRSRSITRSPKDDK